MSKTSDITVLLNQWTDGDQKAFEHLSPLVYDELQKLARGAFKKEASGHTLQPTALVNEVFLNLVDSDISWQGRSHFFALAARMMRRLLINHAKARKTNKRGGNEIKIPLHELNSEYTGDDSYDKLIELDEAISELAKFDERKAELIELQYFAGLSFKEMEEQTGLSSSTLDRELRFSRAWLKNYLVK